MDNLRVENVVGDLVANIEKIDMLLSSAAYRGKDDSGDVQVKRDPTGGVGRPGPSIAADVAPVALPQQLASVRANVRRAENDATQALTPIIAACR